MQDSLEDVQFEQCFYLDRLGRTLRFIFSHPEFAIDSILAPVPTPYQNTDRLEYETNQEAYHPTTSDFPFSSGARAQRVTPPNDAEVHLHDLNGSEAINPNVLLPP